MAMLLLDRPAYVTAATLVAELRRQRPDFRDSIEAERHAPAGTRDGWIENDSLCPNVDDRGAVKG